MHLTLIALIIIVIVMFMILSRVRESLTGLDILKQHILHLQDKIKELNNRLIAAQQQPPVKQEEKTTSAAPVVEVVKPTPEIKPEPVIQKEKPPVIIPEKKEETAEQQIPRKVKQFYNEYIDKPVQQPVNEVEQESWFSKWLKQNPDIEKFIGENLINKIGIAVLVLGIGFFVKYAIDQDWINEVGRVCIGLFCGIVLIVLAHRLKKNYRSFSSVLVGGALAVFYFTIAFAFHQYQLISQNIAFIIMIVITAFAVILSILYDRIEVAILATIGGFITPFLVSTGDGNYIVLFTYLCILNTGLIVLAFYKRWHAINFIAVAFTALIYGGWIASRYDDKTFPYAGTLIYGLVFYCMFLAMTLINVLKKPKLNFFDFAILFSVNLVFYSAAMYLLEKWSSDYKGLLTVSFGILNLIIAYTLFKQKKVDRNFVYLLIGITLTYISLTAPVQLNSNYITLFWCAEIVLLFWLYQKSFIRLFKIASAIITLLAVFSLFMDWIQIYATAKEVIPVVANKGFITSVCAAVAMSLMYILLKKEADTYYIHGLTNNSIRLAYMILAIVLFFMSGLLEVSYQFSVRYENTGLAYIYTELYIVSFVLLLFQSLKYFGLQSNKSLRIIIPAALFILYLLNVQNIFDTEKNLLTKNVMQVHLFAHFIAVILFLILIWQTIQFIRKNKEVFSKILGSLTVFTILAILILLSLEIRHAYLWLIYSNSNSLESDLTLYSKAGLSIVWGLSSFTLIWLGMKYSYKLLRIIALIIFGITLIKLFAFDITNISPAGKIIAFILLGVLLLIVSFMYQRLKKLIIDDPTK